MDNSGRLMREAVRIKSLGESLVGLCSDLAKYPGYSDEMAVVRLEQLAQDLERAARDVRKLRVSDISPYR